MGFYIEVPEKKNKVQQLERLHPVERLPEPVQFVPRGEKVMICVVEGPLFDAIGIVYDKFEFARFTRPTDPRPKTWFLMDVDLAQRLCRWWTPGRERI